MARLPYPDPRLADDLVVLRPWTDKDIAAVIEEKGFDEQSARDWIAACRHRQTDGAGLCLAIADARTDEALGTVGLLFRPMPGTVPVAAASASDIEGLLFQPEPGIVGLGYWVLERARGRGLASRAVSMVVEWTLRAAEVSRVEAFVEVDNIASQRVLEKSGFAKEGCLRSYLAVPTGRADAFIYARLPDHS